jgi:branched-chain amino acid aminotransferase
MSLVWINGHLIDQADAKVSPFDHGFLFGDGVWEPLRVFGGKLLRPDDHMRLLTSSAAQLDIRIPLSPDELVAAVHEILKANHRTDGYIRVIVTRGPGTLGPDSRKLDPQVIIIAEEYQPFPLELYDHGLHVVSVPAPRDEALLLGRPHIVRAKRAALEKGCLEALLVDDSGHVVGSTEGMIFGVRDGALVVAGGHLPEATAYLVATLAARAGIVVVEHSVALVELVAADEVFLAGTSCGVIGIVKIDEHTIGSGGEGPITRRLRERYRATTRGGH